MEAERPSPADAATNPQESGPASPRPRGGREAGGVAGKGGSRAAEPARRRDQPAVKRAAFDQVAQVQEAGRPVRSVERDEQGTPDIGPPSPADHSARRAVAV